ncbi:ATP-NAD kinase-like domain-containing protein [Cercophora scortea]|uniref:ATP-NAD kinase-like domain-containing protein n=1 Tax=Cercophora scortea TaxID=314031 RepID=A0AAE0IGE8_9PEZI|nr:ATP-NAD kinase-like domain-containing protein [Cercophora scortea]
MTVQTPRNASDIQAPTPSHPHLIDAQNGDTENPARRLKSEEIVFVLRTPKNNGGYLVYSLIEPAASGPSNSGDADGDKEDPSGKGSDENASARITAPKNPFEISAVFAPSLPAEILTDFLLDEIPEHLRSHAGHLLHVIVSTHSGTGLAQQFYDAVLQPLLAVLGFHPQEEEQDLGLELGLGSSTKTVGVAAGKQPQSGYYLTITKSSHTIRDFAQSLTAGVDDATAASTSPSRTVILLSGDGGVVDLLNGLDSAAQPSPAPTVALLPLGTGNALFHSLHKPLYTSISPSPSPILLALRTLFKGTAAPLPTFRASFSPGAHLVSTPPVPITHLVGAIVASYGFHAQLVWESDTPAYRVHGDKRFGMAAAELLKESHGYDVRVETLTTTTTTTTNSNNNSQKEWHPLPSTTSTTPNGSDKFSYVLATLVSNLEKTFTISPASKPLDSVLRLLHFGDVGGEKTMEIMMAAYNQGAHVGDSLVGYEAVDGVKVAVLEKDARWRKVCIDGTIVELEEGGWMVVSREEGVRVKVLVDRVVLGLSA